MVPPSRVEGRSAEVFTAFDLRPPRVVEHACRGDEEVGHSDATVGGPDVPETVREVGGGDLLAEDDVLGETELVSRPPEVLVDLCTRAEGSGQLGLRAKEYW